MTYVKICGLMSPEDVEAVNAAHPDLAGFILSPGFRRSIDLEEAHRLIALLDPSICAVGVFVDAPVKDVAHFTHRYDFNGYDAARSIMVQLHGCEDDAI